MKTEITNAAEISVLPLIDNTYKTGGGPFSVGATVVRASKGPVGQIVQVTDSTRERLFGKPLPNGVGQYMEGLRHLAEACNECSYVNVVRVLAEDAAYPHMALIDITDKSAWVPTPDTVYEINDVIELPGGDKLLCLVEYTNTELIETDEDRDFSGAGNWANGDFETYDASDDLSVTATATGQYCELPVANAPTTAGRRYALTFEVSNLVGTFTIQSFDGTQDIGTVDAEGTITLDFEADTTGGIRVVADTDTASADFDNFSLVEEPAAADAEWQAFTTSIEAGATAYGTDLSIGDGYVLQIYPVDGDACENRSFEIVPILDVKGAWVTETEYGKNDVVTITDGSTLVCRVAHTAGETEPTLLTLSPYWEVQTAKHERFTLKFYDKDDLGQEYLLESHTVGIRTSDKDDMGRPAYLPSVLEEQSTRFRANYNTDLAWASIQEGLLAAGKVAFAGGSEGGEPTDDDWIAAWDLFRDDQVYSYLMFAAGNYSGPVLANAIEIAELKHVNFFFDVNPNVNPDNALTTHLEMGLQSKYAAAYYCPFAADDLWYGGKTVWGCSGAVAAACAKGNQNFSGATPGIHYSPAGEKRGLLPRTGILRMFQAYSINRDDFYDARINPVLPGLNGGAVIDDSLNIHYEANYSRFVWVIRIANYIVYRFNELANQVKHEPDGVTEQNLRTGMEEIMDALVTSGALSDPRDPDADGNEPYIITVTQEEIDLWMVYWEFCPTGSARRIAGQPILIK